MRSGNFLSNVIKGSCVFFLFFTIVSREAFCDDGKLDSGKYLKAVRKFADSVIKNGRDVYGDKHTPLFVDGLHVETLEPVIWKFNPSLNREWAWAKLREGWDGHKIRRERAKFPAQKWILSNFASQQPLMRMLDGLTGLTGDKKYRQAAKEATGYVLEHLRTPNGLLYWGGHIAWDLQGERHVGQHKGPIHELKFHQPYFEFMWDVNPESTRRLIEAIWDTHIRDWKTLDYNRHSGTTRIGKPKWDSEFDADIEVPFIAVGGETFCSVMPPLLHSGTMLSVLDTNKDALKWTQRLVYRWQQAKHPKTGLSGGRFKYDPNYDRAKESYKHLYPSINDAVALAIGNRQRRYHQLPLSQIQNGEILLKAGGKYAELGCNFIVWALEDLKIYANRCYNPDTGQFRAMMTDGTILDWKKANKKGSLSPKEFLPRDPDAMLLWGYAMAYRISRDKAYWDMARNICKFMKLGDIGLPGGKERALNFDTDQLAWRIIYPLLELYRVEGDRSMLKLACRIGDNLLKLQSQTGLFPRPGHSYARTGDEVTLVLLHLAEVIERKSDKMPEPTYDYRFFSCWYNHVDKNLPKELAERIENVPGAKYQDNPLFYGRLVAEE